MMFTIEKIVKSVAFSLIFGFWVQTQMAMLKVKTHIFISGGVCKERRAILKLSDILNPKE